MLPTGILLPESVMQTDWFTVFATFVAINTVMYVVLSLTKLFPVIRSWPRRSAKVRSENRSIYPEGSRPE